MPENKTQQTEESVESFLNSIPDAEKRKDSFDILEMMKAVTGMEPKMWGGSIIGFGNLHYKYESGREGDWFYAGFSPRKQNLTLYIPLGFEKHKDELKKLGKYKTGKSCLYINKLSDIDRNILKHLISEGVKNSKDYFKAQ